MGAPRRGACGWPLRRLEGIPRLRARAEGFAVTITSLSTSAFGRLATGEALHYALPAGCYGRKSITKSHQLHLPYPASGRDAKVSKGRSQSPLVVPAGAKRLRCRLRVAARLLRAVTPAKEKPSSNSPKWESRGPKTLRRSPEGSALWQGFQRGSAPFGPCPLSCAAAAHEPVLCIIL